MGKALIIKGADFSKNAIKSKTYSSNDCTITGFGIKYSTGETVEYESYNCSEFINIEGFEYLTLTYGKATGTFGVAFYSTDDVSGYIGGIKYDAQNNYGTTIPNNAKYIRFCTSDNSLAIKVS